MPSQQQISELYDLYTAHPAVTTDSRHIPEGAIFFALRGPSFDGNAFAAEALRKGAALAVVDDPEAIPSGTNPGRDYFLVDNVLQTLQELAAMHRSGRVSPYSPSPVPTARPPRKSSYMPSCRRNTGYMPHRAT